MIGDSQRRKMDWPDGYGLSKKCRLKPCTLRPLLPALYLTNLFPEGKRGSLAGAELCDFKDFGNPIATILFV
jgi:hypothetical protein